MKVINLFAGPGAGKSTTAAYVFARLKMLEMNAEYVSEYAKDLTWERLPIKNQVLVLGKQLQRLVRIDGQVDIAVTDSPLILQTLYNGHVESLNRVAFDLFALYDNSNYYIRRVKPYAQVGRSQAEETAKEFDVACLHMLESNRIPFKTVDGDQDGAEAIVEDIVRARTMR